MVCLRNITNGMSQWKSQKCTGKNLLNPKDAINTTINGVTFTVQNDKSIRVVGTTSTEIYYDLLNNANWEAGTYYISGGISTGMDVYATTEYPMHGGGAAKKWVCSGGVRHIRIRIKSGVVCDDIVRPMISVENTTDYEPYCGGTPNQFTVANCKGGFFSVLPDYGLRVEGVTAQDGVPSPDSPVPIRCVKAGTKVRCCGANLLSAISVFNAGSIVLCEPIHVKAGETYIISFAQPPSASWRIMIYSDEIEEMPASYYIRYFHNGVATRLQYAAGNLTAETSMKLEIMNDFTINAIQVWNTGTGETRIVNPQLERGSVATAYEPYICNEVTVPCDLYEGDVWFPMTGVVERNSYVKAFDGTELWFIRTVQEKDLWSINFNDGVSIDDNSKLTQSRCTHFDRNVYYHGAVYGYFDNRTNVFGQSMYMAYHHFYVDIADSLLAWEAYLAAQYAAGTPVTLVYQRAEPIIEQYEPQPIFASQGVVNLLQTPDDLPAKLSATMMVRR